MGKAEWCIDGKGTDNTFGVAFGELRPMDRSLSKQAPPGSQRELSNVSQDINVLALVKGNERYIFLYDDASRAEALRTLGRYASNPELSFTWYDAAVLSQKIRQAAAPAPVNRPRRFDMPMPMDAPQDAEE